MEGGGGGGGGGGVLEQKRQEEEEEKEKGGREEEKTSSYRYWVRGATEDAVPLPPPKKLSSAHDILNHNPPPPSLGSLWNRAGTWEEKNLNHWATQRIKELIMSVGWLEFPGGGKALISDVSKCVGDAFLVTVRNKKRVGYTYELTFKVKGEWIFNEEKKSVKAHLDVPELSFGELHDLHQLEVRLSEEKDLSQQDKLRIMQDLKLFLEPVREKLFQFERELKDR